MVQWKWVSIKVNNNTNDVSSNNGKAMEEFLTTFPKRTDMVFMEKKKRNTLKGKITKYISNEMTTEMWKELEDNRIILLKKKTSEIKSYHRS